MIVASVFLPRALPGLAITGSGLVGVTNSTAAYNTVEVAAIIVGLLIVAIAGVFTIRSNVAKIWREQAEGEKARNEELTERLAQMTRAHAAELAKIREDTAAELNALRLETKEQHELKHKALAELAAAQMRTDLTPVLTLLSEVKERLAAIDAR